MQTYSPPSDSCERRNPEELLPCKPELLQLHYITGV
uniref:Uncharacterized protein n=1 Tax=Anguilla anguilla TaxID=7936 RepID=A0A0E9P562_ANGAN